MAWYSYVGLFLFISALILLALLFVYDIYQNDKKRTIPFMDAVKVTETYFKKMGQQKHHDFVNAIFWNRNSGYTNGKKGTMLLLFSACIKRELSLFGNKKGFVSEREISYLDINLNKIDISDKGYPEICNNLGKPIFTDLSLEKASLLKWLNDYPTEE